MIGKVPKHELRLLLHWMCHNFYLILIHYCRCCFLSFSEIYSLAVAVEYVSTAVIFFDFLQIFPHCKHTVMNSGLVHSKHESCFAGYTILLQMSCSGCLKKSLAKVSGKVGLIKSVKGQQNSVVRFTLLPTTWMKHTEENQIRMILKWYVRRLGILRVRIERVRVKRDKNLPLSHKFQSGPSHQTWFLSKGFSST